MANRFVLRCVADVLVGLGAPWPAFLSAAHANPTPWLGSSVGIFAIAALVSGYYEPSARRVIVHPFLLMLPAIIGSLWAFSTCRGFECGGTIGMVLIASLLTFVLLGLALAAFFARRRLHPKAEWPNA